MFDMIDIEDLFATPIDWNRKDYKFIKVMTSKIVRNIGGLILSSNKDYHSATIKGRINGFKEYKM